MTIETMTNKEYKRKYMGMELEKDFQKSVMKFARLCDYICIHFPDSRKATTGGWPDLSLIGNDHLILAELKQEGKKRSAIQVEIGDRLKTVEANTFSWMESFFYEYGEKADISQCPFRYFVWQPSDWPEIEATLMRNKN